MMRFVITSVACLLVSQARGQEPSSRIDPSPQVETSELTVACDFDGFIEAAKKARDNRVKRLLTAEQFAKWAEEPNTVVLDARGPQAHAHLRIKGSVNLPYTAFSQETLAKVVPSKETRILIYCRNNFADVTIPENAVTIPLSNGATNIIAQPVDLDLSFRKDSFAGLNIPTYVTLFIYGYHNVWELAPVILPDHTPLKLEGTALAATIASGKNNTIKKNELPKRQ